MHETSTLAGSIENTARKTDSITVQTSNDIVKLLSEQLYKSPLKAIEELVINCYDATSANCRLYIPDPSKPKTSDFKTSTIIVYDDGTGMDTEGLKQLWHIGNSNKRPSALQKPAGRKMIGKFGIGKLATWTICNILTYISKSNKKIHSVAMDYRELGQSQDGTVKSIVLPLYEFGSWDELSKNNRFVQACELAGINLTDLECQNNWTIAILEKLKPKVSDIRLGRLKWVLRTAMPLSPEFHLYLNKEEIKSSKEDIPKAFEFSVATLSVERLKALNEKTGQTWVVKNDSIVSALFPSGIKGNIILFEKILPGKSDDLIRSHGFFVRVRGRLIAHEDVLFGVESLPYEIIKYFKADIEVDDLDEDLVASRESFSETSRIDIVRDLLRALYNEARTRRNAKLTDETEKDKYSKESERNYVSPRLVEHPMADVLSIPSAFSDGADANKHWFYLEIPDGTNIPNLIDKLLSQKREKYFYDQIDRGQSNRLVTFDPTKSTFSINGSHPFVKAHGDDGRALVLLNDIVTAEVLLEVYLRDAGISSERVGEVLERRDTLFRGLALDHPYSLSNIAAFLRGATADERDLEIAIVAAVRALGFVASQISGDGEPDGIARFRDYPGGEIKIVLEAKSSKGTPQLPQLDFAGLNEHMHRHEAVACLLVAPSYPGETKGNDAAAAVRAQLQKISCWTVDLLARFVEAAEKRHFTAKTLLDVILKFHTPDDVEAEIERLFVVAPFDRPAMYSAILSALRRLEPRLKDRPRTLDMVATELTNQVDFNAIDQHVIEDAVRSLAEASAGGIVVRGEQINLLVSIDELARRLAGMTNDAGQPLRKGNMQHFKSV